MYMYSIPRNQSGKKTILAVNHFYDQDIQALINASDSTDLNLIVINPRNLFAPIVSLFPVDIRAGKLPYDDSSVSSERRYAKRISKIIFRTLYRRLNFDIILTPSDAYYWIREFIHVSKNENVPTVVVDKEGTISPYYFVNHCLEVKDLYPPISDKFIVWSENQKEFWSNCGVSPDNIEIIGQPRSDLLMSLKPEKLNLFEEERNPTVLFYTYELDAYIPSHMYEAGLTWSDLRNQCHEQIKRLAQENSEVNFIIKCHPQQLDIEEIENDFNGYENLKVLTGSASSNQLLVNSDLVVGFQTTALIESIVLRKPTIYTFFSESVHSFKEGILPFHEYSAFETVSSDIELYDKIKEFIKNKFSSNIPDESREKLIKRYLNNPDGKVGRRVLNYLQQYLENS